MTRASAVWLLVAVVGCGFDPSGSSGGDDSGEDPDGGGGGDPDGGGGGGGDGGQAAGFRKAITVPALGGADQVDFPLYVEIIATRLRAPAWIAAEFANQSAPASFYTVGPEEAL